MKNFIVFLLIILPLIIIAAIAAEALGFFGLSQNSVAFAGDAALGIMFPLSTLIYLKVYRKNSNREILDGLGLGRNKLNLGMIAIGVIIFFIITLMSLGVGLLQNIIHTPINTNVSIALAGAPLWFYVFAAVIEPINEEVLFRGFMVPRIGIILSSIIFGILHYTYDSTFAIEVIAAVVFGLIAGYAYRKTGSLYPSIIAHILINTLAIVALL